MKAVRESGIRCGQEEEIEFGGLLLEKKTHPILKQYLERELRIRNEILIQLRDASGLQQYREKKK